MLAPAQYRTVCTILGGESNGEAAKRLRLSPSTIANNLRRAVERMPELALALAVARNLHKRQKRGKG